MSNLKELYLNTKTITSLPTNISYLTNLKRILFYKKNWSYWNRTWNIRVWKRHKYDFWNIVIIEWNDKNKSLKIFNSNHFWTIEFDDKNFVNCLSNSSNVLNNNFQKIQLNFIKLSNWNYKLTNNFKNIRKINYI